MNILVLNCGSSSVKYTVLDMPDGVVIASGAVERIGEPEPAGTYRGPDGDLESTLTGADHQHAVNWISKTLKDHAHAVSGIGHRIVHGGEAYTTSTVITEEVEAGIESLSHLAPLHHPAHLQGIRSARDAFPGLSQVAVFDTAFHQSLPDKAYRYTLPPAYYDTHQIRRYGFHGTSHRYVAHRAAALLGVPVFTGVTCHLGNGSSLAAIQDGKSIDTSMGLTPLGGIPMGTRSGDLDPAIVLYLQEHLGYDVKKTIDLLNKRSGLLGLSGVSNDLRAVETEARSGNTNAALAIDILCYQTAKLIGGYLAILSDADGIVFTGGIGENAVDVRKRIVDELRGLRIAIDTQRNEETVGREGMVSSETSEMNILIIPTKEEKVIAEDTYALLQAT